MMEVRIETRPVPELTGRDRLQQYPPGQAWAVTETSNWTVAAYLAQKGDTFVVGEIRVYPTEAVESSDPTLLYETASIPGNGLTATLLHNFRFGEFVAAGIHKVVTPMSDDMVDLLDWDDDLTSHGFDRKEITADSQKRRRGRPPLDDHELATVAYLYEKAIREQAKSPIKFVADALNDPNPDRVRQVVSKCRKRGFLTPPPAKGIAGGHITDKAIAVLRLESKT